MRRASLLKQKMKKKHIRFFSNFLMLDSTLKVDRMPFPPEADQRTSFTRYRKRGFNEPSCRLADATASVDITVTDLS